jgi:predicted N-acyltransferase
VDTPLVELNPRLHRSATNSPRNVKPSIFRDVHSKIADAVSPRLLVCGNALLSGEHGHAMTGNDEKKVLSAIVEAANAIRKSEKKGILVTLIKDFYDRNNHATETLSRCGYYSFDAGPNMVIPIRPSWTSFDEYLRRMKSKYRKRAASAIKKGAEIRRKTLRVNDLITYKDELYALYSQVVDTAKFKLFFLSPDYFIELKKRLGDRFTCDAYFHGDALIGFTTRIFNHDTMEGYTHGLNYSLNKAYELYQNFLFDDIRAAIAARSGRINTGRTSIAMKSSAGAEPESMRCYMRFSGAHSNQVINSTSVR